MLSSSRAREMYDRVVALGNVVKTRKVSAPLSGEATCSSMKLDVTMPEVLVGLGIAVTEEEAHEFIVYSILSAMQAKAEGIVEKGDDVLLSLVNFGFFVGLLAGRTSQGGTN
jgi:hypothetical protein